MTTPAYVAVDWGTSSFRLWLMAADDRVLAERRSGEGMTTAARLGFAGVLDAHLDAVKAPADLPVIVCGMAGARQGWIEAGYVDVPCALSAVLDGAVSVPGTKRDVRILPGLAQRSGTPDVMRGEETQLLGALSTFGDGERHVCMPGTHSKWVHVANGAVTGFSTFMTGELFDVISKHSILAHTLAGAEGSDAAEFGEAAEAAFRQPALATNFFFGIRAAQLLNGLGPTAAQSRLSGTLLGLELAGAHAAAKPGTAIALVASGRLQSLYEAAFQRLGLEYATIDADDAVRRGLAAAARSIWPQQQESHTA
ncbi:2-dehydro-3-deoxygalactonokinase [Rhizobiaceae bacterium n13]|uniref:2-dehydro-3-deoxygalactonokinase n=1 Tax=Ferirhizobium litorale TaxID=2927786 RepID=A0AAE3QD62_9HYPH|nr:2-dehydro-3-deoxygalactonokinase [Fererhizobium litorale]MDI7861522.1 2-dehydro-3-deoxygalactonokinase [Fererhizobium litorale]MDI7921668.1 2-dehydro-3-deoxygalactonokinase [Fererhizobium litorale]